MSVLKNCGWLSLAVLLAGPLAAGTKEGVVKWQAGDYPAAVAEWRAPAAAGDADAQFNLGQAYKLGRGVPVDLGEAAAWYRKAAVQGHKAAEANLGLVLFQQGERETALPYLRRAAEAGEPRAQYVLGIAHFNGDIVPRDWVRAYALMIKAAAAGVPQAASGLAEMDKYIPLRERERGAEMAQAMRKEEPQAGARAASAPQKAPSKPAAAAARPKTAALLPAAAKPAAAKADGGAWRVQLGAFSGKAAAQSAWGKAQGRVAALKPLDPFYVPAGAVFRLQAGPIGSRADANRLCESIIAGGLACFPVNPR